jgi:DNA-binding transcriptional ArsR family regulator
MQRQEFNKSANFDDPGLDLANLAKLFQVLADPNRLHLLVLIAENYPHGICACDLVEPSGKSQPTVSHHLKTLSGAGLISGEKKGKWIWYNLTEFKGGKILGLIKELSSRKLLYNNAD